MRQADRRDTVIFFQIKTHNRLGSIACQSGSHVKTSKRGRSIWRYTPLTLKGLPIPMPRMDHLPPGRTPCGWSRIALLTPTTSFAGQDLSGLEDKFSRASDRDFLGNRIAYACWIHEFFSL